MISLLLPVFDQAFSDVRDIKDRAQVLLGTVFLTHILLILSLLYQLVSEFCRLFHIFPLLFKVANMPRIWLVHLREHIVHVDTRYGYTCSDVQHLYRLFFHFHRSFCERYSGFYRALVPLLGLRHFFYLRGFVFENGRLDNLGLLLLELLEHYFFFPPCALLLRTLWNLIDRERRID